MMQLPALLVTLSGALTTYLALSLIRRYWQLKHVPGPFLAAFTNFWRFRIQYFGRGAIQPVVHDLHKRYGPVVRVGPNTVSLADPADIGVVFNPRAGFVKADSYGTMRAFVKGRSIGSILDIQDEEKSKAIRRAVGGVFLTRNMVEDHERDVDAMVEALVESLERYGDAAFNLYAHMQRFQIDTMLKVAFGEDAGCLRQGRDMVGLSGLPYKRLMHWYTWQAMPELEKFIFQNWMWSGWLVRRKPSRWASEGVARVEARKGTKALETSGRKDLLQKYIDGSRAHPDAIPQQTLFGLVNSTISAGTDTTAGALSVIIYYLMKNPEVLRKLLRELQDAGLSPDSVSPIRYNQVEGLPYLDAVIKEALRLHAALGTLLERKVPPQGCTLAGVHLPGGTVVGFAPYVIHRDEAYFGRDADVFRPERWLEVDQKGRQAMERSSLVWSQGSRICLGKNLAELEMKKVVPTLVLKFEFKLCDPGLDITFERGIFEGEERPVMVTAAVKA
ncbi:hypothetical protein MFIFM68171_01554 [Madurella fahalii]|uniref:Pisatin demethylase n=1 Tax=Madurella fahalii TaxID=1157608 RepID=A0ABQ0G0R1_9PEZI